MIPNLYVLSSTGEIIIEKQWLTKHKRSVCDTYWEFTSNALNTNEFSMLTSTLGENSITSNPSSSTNTKSLRGGVGGTFDRSEIIPLLPIGKFIFVNVYRCGLTFLVILSKDTLPLFILECLHLVVDTLIDYIGGLNDTTIREHFSTVYQLFDEMFDGGYASTTEHNQLKEMIAPPSLANMVLQNLVVTKFAVSDRLPIAAISKIPWRRCDASYLTEKIFFDLVESLDCIINADSGVISAVVHGEIRCDCRLSGMPDLTLTFSNQDLLDDVSLHRCIRINRYVRERVLSFVPPDGEFKLMSYKCTGALDMPIFVKPEITYKAGSGRVHITVGTRLSQDKVVNGVALVIPFPSVLRSHTLVVNTGSLSVDTATNIARWEIPRLSHEITPTMEGGLIFLGDQCPEELPTIQAEFNIRSYNVSGLKVDGLAIRNITSRQKPFKGVRGVTQNGKFLIRCGHY
jgi:AP-3 complex subunit mu